MTENMLLAPQEISMDGFQVVRGDMFAHVNRYTDPTLTLWATTISFSKAAILALNGCERVRIEVNANAKCILIVPATEMDTDSVRWLKRSAVPSAKKIDCSKFTGQLFNLWEWDTNYVYRAKGKLVSADRKVMLLFDFSEPDCWEHAEKPKED